LQKIENIETLVNLEKLFLCSNKISVIENLSSLSNLTMLELGDNKIRVSFSLPPPNFR
jgi:protein phosphatase 1 regulatory subunit 7